MFTGYNLKLSDDFFDNKMSLDEYKKIGEKHLNDKIYEYKNNLNDYINKGIISEVNYRTIIFLLLMQMFLYLILTMTLILQML